MKTITIGELEIDIHDGPIGMMMSGGADSSILFYILSKYAPGPIHVFSCGNGMTNNQEPIGALKVINYTVGKLHRKDIYFRCHWVDNKKAHNMIFADHHKQSGINIMYAGFTRPPPEGAITEFDNDGIIAIGDVYDGSIYPKYLSENDSDTVIKLFGSMFTAPGLKLYTPFAHTNKQGIAKLYKELYVEELYLITRSCENLTLTEGHCGTCWWCKERLWAFGRLD